VALTDTLTKANARQPLGVVATLARELEAWRLARSPNVIPFAPEEKR